MSSMQQTSLETLYVDALLKIVEYLSPTWIVNLWLTGAVQLRTSLAKRGAVTSLKLRLVSGFFSPSRLPGMIASFERLTCLQISSPFARIATPLRMWQCLSQLHLLRTLEVVCPEADEWLFAPGTFDVDLICYPLDDDAAIPYEDPQVPKMHPLATTYPYLEKLELKHDRLRRIQNEHFLDLPPTLTSLTLESADLVDENCMAYMKNLPKLASLKLYARECLEMKGTLPSSITSLIFSTHQSVTCPASFWVHSNIVELDLSLDSASIACLPPTIEKFFTRCTTNSAALSLKHLPQLKHLNAADPLDPDSVPKLENWEGCKYHASYTVERMPKGLKCAYFTYSAVTDTNYVISLLRSLSQLTTVTISTKVNLASTDLCNLPSTLTSIDWYSFQYEGNLIPIDDAISNLPRGLKRLTFTCSNVALSTAAYQLLPRGLQHLVIKTILSTEHSPQELTTYVKGLPRSLTLLSTDTTKNGVQWTADMLGALPNLRQLFLSTSSYLWSQAMVSRLPQSLRIFHLSGTQIALDAFSSLPSCLETLSYYVSSFDAEHLMHQQCRESLALLPRNLLHLSIDHTDTLIDEDLQHLPPRLMELSLSGTSKLTKEALRFIPVHCLLRGFGAPVSAQQALKQRLENLPFQDPDPRVVGRPFEWY